MMYLALLFVAFASISSCPVPTKKVVNYENTILHKDNSPKPIHNVAPIMNSAHDNLNLLKAIESSTHSYPEYEFAYGVWDPKTGDHKDQWEKRAGDRVRGVYMLVEADGTQRIVEYEADDKRGFRAKVTNVGQKHLEEKIKWKSDGYGVATSYNMLTKAN
ncbi:larval cuticle protein A2B-like [Armigeres subalbatus]|uniref:larval cuticle protein A2B-like n=1 Tax=Armigeres subalbatus TaxID=124917 RepID=UPI002ED4BAD5